MLLSTLISRLWIWRTRLVINYISYYDIDIDMPFNIGSGSFPIRTIEPPQDMDSAIIVFRDMKKYEIILSESCYTAMIRCYSMNGHLKDAIELYYELRDKRQDLTPKLRTYTHMLALISSLGELQLGFELYRDMNTYTILPSEKEYLSMLKLTIAKIDDRFYSIFDDMMEDILIPSKASWDIVRKWFDIDKNSKLYQVIESSSSNGIISHNNRKLLSIDLDEDTRANLLSQIESFASSRASNLNTKTTNVESMKIESIKFNEFKQYLSLHKFDIVVDGANVGYYKQNYIGAPTHVDYFQIDWMIECLRSLGYNPLLILHIRHLNALKNSHREDYSGIMKKWKHTYNCIYTTPSGWNDDWFWMYACVKIQCHIITNDEMRDHHFQMLSPRWFSRWKERHVVHFSFGKWINPSTYPLSFESLEIKSQDIEDSNLPQEKKQKIQDNIKYYTSHREAILQIPNDYSYRTQKISVEENPKVFEYYVPQSEEIDKWLCILPLVENNTVAI